MADDATQSGPRPGQSRKTLGGYELLGKIGQGAMGAVFKARQTSMDRVVALKVLPQRLAKDKEYVARFLREARSAARLNHVKVVKAFDAGEADGYYYLAMEFVDGPSLDDLLKMSGALSEQRALEITRDIAQALEAAHRVGLIHRDVKPANILLTSDGTAKLADLGLARESMVDSDSSLTSVGVALGTPDYMAPEQVRGEQDLDERCDIYALGATLYHFLAGSPPYPGGTGSEVMAKHLHESVPDPRSANPGVSLAAGSIIRKAMAKKQDDRYANASEMLSAIEALLGGLQASSSARATQDTSTRAAAVATPPPAPLPAEQPRRKMWLTVVGAAAAIVLIIGLSIALLTPPEDKVPERDERRKMVQTPKADAVLLASLRDSVKQHPHEHANAISRYRRAMRQMTDPDTRMAAAKDLRALQRKLEAAARKALAPLKERAARLAKTGDYDGAIAAFDKLPAQFTRVVADSARNAKARLRAEANAKVETVLGEARKLGAKGKYDEALAELKRLDALRYAGGVAKISGAQSDLIARQNRQVEEIRRQVRERAVAKVDEVLNAIDDAAKKNPAGAKELAEAALKDPALKPAGDTLTTAARVGTLVAGFGGRRRAALIESLKKLQGQRILLETAKGKKGGKVKEVTNAKIVLDRSFKIGDTVGRLPDETVLIADLTAATLEKHCPKLNPGTPDELIAAAILAMACEDWEGMKTALAGAPGHLLHNRYKKKLDDLTPVPAEKTDLWSHHEKVSVSGYTSDLEDHQVKLTVDHKTGMAADYADLLFTDQAKKPLSHWIEAWSKTKAIVWIKVPAIPQTGTTITMHYGNPQAESRSSGNATFIFFDDFTAGFNSSKWSRKRIGSAKSCGAFVWKGNMCIAGGQRKKKLPAWIMTKRLLPRRLIIENRFKLERTSDSVGGGIAIVKAACKIDASGSPGGYALVNFHYNFQKRWRRVRTNSVWIYSGARPYSRSSVSPYWRNEWFRQSHYYDGTSSSRNVLYVRNKDGEEQRAALSAPAVLGNVRLHIWPVGDGEGPRHYFLIDWIAVRNYARPDVVAVVGDLPAAAEPHKPVPPRPKAPGFTGLWRVIYSHGAVRTYHVGADDTVQFIEERRRGALRRGQHVLLQFGDGKIERWTLVKGRLLVQHWNPASGYPRRPPDVTGQGVKVR